MAVLGLVALAVTGGGAAAGTAAKGKGPDPAKIQKLKSEARGSVAISSNDATDYVAFVRAGRNGDLLPKSTGSPAAKANDFIGEYGDILGLESGSGLVRTDTAIDRQGAVHLSYKQVYKGLPVFGASVKAHVDAQGDLTAVNGTVVPVADLSTSPRLSAGQAAARAIEAVASEPMQGDEGLPAFGTAGDLRAESTRAARLPHRPDPGRHRHRPARVPRGRDERRGHPRGRDRPGQCWQGDQPLLADPRRLAPRGLRAEPRQQDLGGGRPVPRRAEPRPAEHRHLQRGRVPALLQRVRPRLVRRRGRVHADGQQRPADQLPERELERDHDELLQRRDRGRRRRPRVGPRVHPVHAQPHLPVAAGRPERVLLGHLGRDRRRDQRRGHRLA